MTHTCLDCDEPVQMEGMRCRDCAAAAVEVWKQAQKEAKWRKKATR